AHPCGRQGRPVSAGFVRWVEPRKARRNPSMGFRLLRGRQPILRKPPMILRELFPHAAFDERHAGRAVGGVAVDSRKVKPGDAFVAVPGTKADGLAFVPAALAAGAVAIVAEKPPTSPLPEGVAFALVDDARRALALAAAKVHPRQPDVIAAVTGTSGKTSVTVFARQIWTALGFKAASI